MYNLKGSFKNIAPRKIVKLFAISFGFSFRFQAKDFSLVPCKFHDKILSFLFGYDFIKSDFIICKVLIWSPGYRLKKSQNLFEVPFLYSIFILYDCTIN